MDFDTGRRPEGSQGAPRSSGGAPPRAPSSAGGGDFNLSDPINSFVGAVRSILLSPRSFFRSIARQGDFVGPLVFALICAVISGVLSGAIGFLSTLIVGDIVGAVMSLVGDILLTPIIAVIVLFITAGIWHLLVLLLVKPRNAGFEATFRVAAYAAAIQLITWVAAIQIPNLVVSLILSIIALIATIYSLYISYFGIQELHSTTNQRAAAVVAIPVLVVIFLAILFGAAIAALFSVVQ